jgi:hypothetical protein
VSNDVTGILLRAAAECRGVVSLEVKAKDEKLKENSLVNGR